MSKEVEKDWQTSNSQISEEEILDCLASAYSAIESNRQDVLKRKIRTTIEHELAKQDDPKNSSFNPLKPKL